MKLRIKKNPLAKVTFRIFALCLCLLASTVQATAQEVVYELVTNASQLVAGEKYIIATADGKYAMGKQKVDNKNRQAVSIDNKKAGNYIIGIAIASEQEQEDKVYEFTLGGKVGGWTFYDGTYPGYLYASGKNKAFGNVKNNQNYLETKMLLDKKSQASINIESGEVRVKFL